MLNDAVNNMHQTRSHAYEDVKSIGQSSFAQAVGSDVRCQYQCRHTETDGSIWKSQVGANKSHVSVSSNASCLSHKSQFATERSSNKNTLSDRETIENQENSASHQHSKTVNHNGTNRPILSDMTNRNRQRIGGDVLNSASGWNKGKENHFNQIHNENRSPMTAIRESKSRCSLEDIMEPLSVRRLRPIRQTTRNVVLSILDDETVCLEFIKPKGKEMYVTEVLRISSDGNKITSYNTNGREGLPLQDTPIPIPGTAVSYAFSGLPQKLWKKYQYADKFIRLVRMKSPKVSYVSFQFHLSSLRSFCWSLQPLDSDAKQTPFFKALKDTLK